MQSAPRNMPPFARSMRALLALSLGIGVALFVAFTAHWKMMVDSPIIHYANFEISHGVAPYRELQENNLPGAYLAEWFGMHVFGGGDVAWRVFEFFELLTCTLCMVWLAWTIDWMAGLFAGGVFTVLHGAEGPYFSGEREVAMTTLILCGYAALFAALRRERPGWMLPAGFTMAFAAAIKPTVAPLPLLLMAAVIVLRRRDGRPWAVWLLWALAGAAIAVALNIGFLLHHHALDAFLQLQRTITTYYAQLAALTVSQMVRRFFYQPVFDVLLACGVVLYFTRRRDAAEHSSSRRSILWTREQRLIAIGACIGVLSYVVQRKDFLHHRYLFQNLLLLLIGTEVLPALRSRFLLRRSVAAAAVAFVALWIVPVSAHTTRRFHPQSDLTAQLEADLQQLGGTEALQRRVVCLDQVFGCLNALYHLQLVENAPLSGDMLLFARRESPVIGTARAWFARTQQQHPADVVVMTNENFQSRNDYTRIINWPAYADVLTAQYTLLTDRSFPCEFGHRDPEEAHLYRYRIYVRNGSGLAGTQLAPQSVYTCR